MVDMDVGLTHPRAETGSGTDEKGKDIITFRGGNDISGARHTCSSLHRANETAVLHL